MGFILNQKSKIRYQNDDNKALWLVDEVRSRALKQVNERTAIASTSIEIFSLFVFI
jgi:hypothetical protein